MRKHAVLAMLAAAILAGCGKEESSSGGGSGSGSGTGGGVAAAKTPEDAWKDMRRCFETSDGKGLWNSVCAASRKNMTEGDGAKQIESMKSMEDAQLEAITKENFDMSAAEFRKASVEEIMISSFNKVTKDPKEKEKILKTKWKSCEIKGDKAYCVTLEPGDDGKEKEDYAVLVKEDGTWKVNIEDTEKFKDEKKGG